jgi:short-subunit dehydrogenase
MRTRSLVKRISYEIDERLRKIIETIKTSLDLLKRDYSDDPQIRDLVKELETSNKKIDRMIKTL